MPARPSLPAGLASLMLALALLTSGCATKHHLGEYDFRDRTLAVTTLAPPYPEVFSALRMDIDEERPLETILRVAGDVAREAAMLKTRARLDSVARTVEVSERLGARVLAGASRHLRTTPTADARRADFELEIVVKRYGISASSWTSRAQFTIEADLRLLDGATGRRIWKTSLRATDPIQPTVLGDEGRTVSGALTAIALANLSSEEMRRALEALSDYAADRMVDRLAESLDDARP